MIHPSAEYSLEKTFSSRVNETEKPFKDSLGYPLNPLNPSNLPNPSNMSNPPNPCPHPPNPRFEDGR